MSRHTHHHDTATTDVQYACVPCLCRILLSITAPTFCIISILMFTRMMTRTLTRVVSTFRHAAFCPSGSPAAARGASGTLPQCMLGPLMPCLWQWCEQCEHCQVHHEVFMECLPRQIVFLCELECALLCSTPQSRPLVATDSVTPLANQHAARMNKRFCIRLCFLSKGYCEHRSAFMVPSWRNVATFGVSTVCDRRHVCCHGDILTLLRCCAWHQVLAAALAVPATHDLPVRIDAAIAATFEGRTADGYRKVFQLCINYSHVV